MDSYWLCANISITVGVILKVVWLQELRWLQNVLLLLLVNTSGAPAIN